MADGDNTPKMVPVEELDKVKSQVQTWMAKATDFEKRFAGIDPDGYKAMKEDYDLLRKNAATKSPEDLEKLLKDKEAEFEKRYAQKFEELQKTTTTQAEELRRLRVTNVVMKDAGELFPSESLELLEPIINRDCEWVDGKIVIKDASGKPRTSLKDPRNIMDHTEYLETLVQKYPTAAKSTAVPGNKSPGDKAIPAMNGIKSLNDLAKFADKGKAAMAAMPPEQLNQILKTPIRLG